MWPLMLLIWLGAALLMAVIWLLQRRTHNAGLVDVAWSAGLGLAAVAAGLLSAGWAPRRGLVAFMGGAWGFRLAAYLWRRVSRGPEDGRYQALRTQWGERVEGFLFWFFQFQALTVAIFALPWLVAMRRPATQFTGWDVAGLALWCVAVGGESLADAQLARFRRDPANAGRVLRFGLWRYSRHPNYFFEWLHWFAYVAIGLVAPAGWLTLLGPALMLLFLYKVTGVPATEQRALQSRGAEYRRYQRTTSAFIPWRPKREN
jgi:steroid 5-alpha reductase family enzyme